MAYSMLVGLPLGWLGTAYHQLWSDDGVDDGGCGNDDGSGDDCLHGFLTVMRSRSRQRLWKRELQKHDKKGWRLWCHQSWFCSQC